MRLLIAAVGRLKQGPERDLFRHYLGRTEMAGSKLGLAPVTVIEVPESRGPTAAARTAAEAMVMLGKVPPSHKLVCLDRARRRARQRRVRRRHRQISRHRRPWPRFSRRRRRGARAGGAGPRRSEAVARAHDLAARARPHRACRAALSRCDHPRRPSLSPCLTSIRGRRERLRFVQHIRLDSALSLRFRSPSLEFQLKAGGQETGRGKSTLVQCGWRQSIGPLSGQSGRSFPEFSSWGF